MSKEKKGNTVGFRPSESTKEALNKVAHNEDRSISYIVEREVRKGLGLD
jgi:predicted transcriptional regulator